MGLQHERHRCYGRLGERCSSHRSGSAGNRCAVWANDEGIVVWVGLFCGWYKNITEHHQAFRISQQPHQPTHLQHTVLTHRSVHHVSQRIRRRQVRHQQDVVVGGVVLLLVLQVLHKRSHTLTYILEGLVQFDIVTQRGMALAHDVVEARGQVAPRVGAVVFVKQQTVHRLVQGVLDAHLLLGRFAIRIDGLHHAEKGRGVDGVDVQWNELVHQTNGVAQPSGGERRFEERVLWVALLVAQDIHWHLLDR